MANPEPSSEFYSAIGLEKSEAQEVRSYLEQRIVSAINKFPFSSPGTTELPILSFEYPEDPGKVILPGFEKGVNPSSLEALMDNVLISKSVFNEDYSPVRNLPKHIDVQKRKLKRSWKFPIALEGGRMYFVTKEVNYTKEIVDGKMVDRKERIRYFASLPPKEELMPLK